MSAGCALLLAASPASALHCEQVSKNPDAGQAAEKDSSTPGAGRSWNSGGTGGFVGNTFARNLLVNGGCGGANGVYIEDGCLADCNADRSLDILDFVCFQGLFQTMAPEADCNADGVLNILDFVCFQKEFQRGCP